MKFVFAFLYLVITVLLYTVADEDKSEYKFVFQKLDKEIAADDIVISNLSFDNRDDQVYVNGELKQLVDLDDDWKAQITIFRAENSEDEFSKIMVLPEKGVCDMMKSLYKTYFYESLKNYANAPDPENCPVTEETYTIKDYPVDTSKFKKLMKPGYYRISCTLLNKEEEKLKYIFYGHVEEVN